MLVRADAAAVARSVSRSPWRRRGIAALVLAVALPVSVMFSLAFGARSVPVAEAWAALFDYGGTDEQLVVRSLRVPRTVLGLVVGFALGLAGALAQGHTRNPLADPGLLGVAAGASLATVGAITAGVTHPAGYSWFAFGGALVASVLVFAIAATASGHRSGTVDPLTLALAGATVTALLTALTTAVLLLDSGTLDSYRFWVVGSITGRGYDVLVPVVPFLAVGAALAFAQGPILNTLGLGTDVAQALGVRPGRARFAGIVAITLLTGGAVAACGPIAFVGLVAPHIARAVTGPDYRWLIPMAGAVGAVLLLAADVAGRLVARPGELMVGVSLAFVGAPFFIALVRRRRLVTL